jgi:hypothetical protein
MFDVIPIVGIISSSAMVVLIVYFVTRSRQRRVEAQVDMQNRMIDRFGSAPELIEFLHSPAGRQFVAGVQEAPVHRNRDRIISGFTRAILLTMLGAAFLFITFFEGDRDFAIPAAILFCLGIGYFAATVLAYKLSTRLEGRGVDAPFGTNDPARS